MLCNDIIKKKEMKFQRYLKLSRCQGKFMKERQSKEVSSDLHSDNVSFKDVIF